MKRRKLFWIVAALLLGSVILTGIGISFRVKNQTKALFRLNKELQREGYFMADFEFMLLGFSYHMDKGKYFKALKSISEYHSRLKKKDGLIKIPRFTDKQEEIDFYLDLQNPETGAFITDSAPFCTYWEVTQNILDHLETLSADSSIAPLKLKYPLIFLDEINTPGKLVTHLNDISYVGRIASKFPQTTFHFARNLLSCAKPDNVLDRNNLYPFSPEWKHAMLKWMYEFQDSVTGMWGPKNRKTKALIKLDLNNTASILKAFRDNDGNDLYAEFPLRYADKLFSTSLNILSEPYPADEEKLEEIHEWNLKKVKGFNMILRFLWKDASEADKKTVEELLEDFIKISFEKYYIKSEGAFSYYPNAKTASADGLSNMIFDNIGALSYEKQKKLFGESIDSVQTLGSISNQNLKAFFQTQLPAGLKINSIRFYKSKPDMTKLTENVWAVYYPTNSGILDVTELVPKLIAWADSTSLSVGNWKSIAGEKKELEKYNIKKPLILPENSFEPIWEQTEGIYCIGFNTLQIPKFIIKFNS